MVHFLWDVQPASPTWCVYTDLVTSAVHALLPSSLIPLHCHSRLITILRQGSLLLSPPSPLSFWQIFTVTSQLLFLPDPSPCISLCIFCTFVFLTLSSGPHLLQNTLLVLWWQGFHDLVSRVLIHPPLHLCKFLLSEFRLPISIWKIFSNHWQVLSKDARNPEEVNANIRGVEVKREWQAESTTDYMCDTCDEGKGLKVALTVGRLDWMLAKITGSQSVPEP